MFYRSHVLVCSGSNCNIKGCQVITEALRLELLRLNLDKEVRLVETGCLGLCEHGPALVVYPEGVMYVHLTTEDIAEVAEEHQIGRASCRERV